MRVYTCRQCKPACILIFNEELTNHPDTCPWGLNIKGGFPCEWIEITGEIYDR